MAMTPVLRWAIFVQWPEKCVWCTKPLVLVDMEVDHLIPKSLKGDELQEVLSAHGLPDSYDVEAEENFAPSCGGCNTYKHKHAPPTSPVVSELLKDAASRAEAVRKTAKEFASKQKLSNALGYILQADTSNADIVTVLNTIFAEVGSMLESAQSPHTSVPFTDFAGIALGPEGEWFVARFTGFGDCPNDNCYTGDIDWQAFPGPEGEGGVESGICNTCGTVAVRCPDCETVTGAFFDDVPCEGCGAVFGLDRDPDSGDVNDVVVTKPSDENV